MKNIKIACWSAGNNNILWVGTDGNGIIKISLRTKNFGSVTNISYGAMYNQPVRAFCKFGNTLWVGTKGGGILSFDISGENDAPSKKQNYTYPAHLDNNSVYVLQRTSGNFIVIGSDGRGFSLFDIAKNRFYNGMRYPALTNARNLPLSMLCLKITIHHYGSEPVVTDYYILKCQRIKMVRP